MNYLVVATLLVWLPHPTAAASPRPSGLEAYAGRYPSDKVGDQASFFDAPPIHDFIARKLSDADREFLQGLHVETPISRVGEYLVLNVCKPHDCPCHHATMTLHLASGRVSLGLWRAEAGASWITDRGRGQEAPKELPCAALAVFHFGHAPRLSDKDAWCERREPKASGVDCAQ